MTRRTKSKVGGIGANGCTCAVRVGMCPVHNPEDIAARQAQWLKSATRSLAAMKGWRTRKRNQRKRAKND